MSKPTSTKRDFSCGGVVWDAEREKVLLIFVQNLRKQKVWTFPKGHPEHQELDEQAAIREVREETGWSCKIDRPFMDVQYSYLHKGIKVNKTVRWFLMRPETQVGEFQKEEVLDCRWCDLEEAKGLLSYESDDKLLKRLSLLV